MTRLTTEPGAASRSGQAPLRVGAGATTARRPEIGDVLDGTGLTAEQLDQFNGFGGLHGGVLSALLLRSMRTHVEPSLAPLELTTHFLKSTREAPEVLSTPLRRGRATTVMSASATVGSEPVATGTAAFASSAFTSSAVDLSHTVTPQPPPGLTPLPDAERFVVPPEFVPISTRMEIRPATRALPYSGSPEPELCAWIRLTEPVEHPTERLLVLADALAPSYAAVLTDLLLIPSVRMTVRFTPLAHSTDFEWVLVRARTTEAQVDAWLTEVVDIWTPDGAHLASASQLRVVR